VYRTELWLNTHDYGIQKPPYGTSWQADNLIASKSDQVNLLLVGDGWTIQPNQYTGSSNRELSLSTESVLKTIADGGTLRVADKFQGRYSFSSVSLSGVTAASGVASQGDYMISKRVTANTSWESNLETDQDAYPGLDAGAPDLTTTLETPKPYNYSVDRVAVDESSFSNSPFMFRFTTQGLKASSPDVLSIIYFSGPANNTGVWSGKGQYCLRLQGDGSFDLWEFQTSTASGTRWKRYLEGAYAPKDQVSDSHHTLIVFPSSKKIRILVTQADQSFPSVSTISKYFQEGANGRQYVFSQELKSSLVPEPIPQPIALRVSQRRDLILDFQLSRLSYPSRGYLVTRPFIIPSIPSSAMVVEWFGSTNGGSVNLSLFDERVQHNGDPSNLLNTGCTIISSGLTSNGGYALFSLPTITSSQGFPMVSDGYRVRALLTSNVSDSPKVNEIRIGVSGQSSQKALVPFQITYPALLTEVSLTTGSNDITTETLGCTIVDKHNNLNLTSKGEYPCQLRFHHPAGSSILHEGYISFEKSLSKGYPIYTGRSLGKWKRLKQTVSTFNWDFSIDPAASGIVSPYAVDVIDYLLRWSGFPQSQIAIPTSETFPIRLWPRGDRDTGNVIQAGANIYDFAQSIANSFLNSILYWDPNLQANGCWTLLTPPSSVSHTFTGGSLAASSLVTLSRPGTSVILKEGYMRRTEAPEANRIVVTGTGDLNNSNKSITSQVTQYAINFDSIYSSGSIDYIGSEVAAYYVDTIGINTPEAAAWVCRRIYDQSAHAQEIISFLSPLSLVGSDNRALRYGDLITVQGSSMMVSNLTIAYDKDTFPLQKVECKTVPPNWSNV